MGVVHECGVLCVSGGVVCEWGVVRGVLCGGVVRGVLCGGVVCGVLYVGCCM